LTPEFGAHTLRLTAPVRTGGFGTTHAILRDTLFDMGAEMSDALRKAFEIAGRLPKSEQDELAAAILEELASDERWDAALGQSQEALARLADEALAEHRTGRTKALDPDAL
jgi:hypothetical protein